MSVPPVALGPAASNKLENYHLELITPLLRLAVSRASQAAEHLRFSFGVETELACAVLLLATIDHGRSVLALLAAKAYPGIPVIGRSAVEAYIDICNLCSKPGHWRHLDADGVARFTEYDRLASSGENPILAPLTQMPEIDELRRYYARRRQALGKQKIKKLRIIDKFERAKMMAAYNSYYGMMSSETHNGLENLKSRYVDMDDERLRLRRPGEQGGHRYEAPVSLTVSEIIVRGTEKVLVHFGHGTAVMAEASMELERITKLCLTLEEQAIGQALVAAEEAGNADVGHA
jgi:hypothetical protein